MRWVLRSKIHRATVTNSNVDYAGSISIDEDLVDAAGFWLGEKVLVASVSSGARLETYIIAGKRGSGEVCMNGAAACKIKKGELVTIMGFELVDEPIKSNILDVDESNQIVKLN